MAVDSLIKPIKKNGVSSETFKVLIAANPHHHTIIKTDQPHIFQSVRLHAFSMSLITCKKKQKTKTKQISLHFYSRQFDLIWKLHITTFVVFKGIAWCLQHRREKSEVWSLFVSIHLKSVLIMHSINKLKIYNSNKLFLCICWILNKRSIRYLLLKDWLTHLLSEFSPD